MKILNKLASYIGVDKILHFLVGALIVAQFEIFEWYWVLIAIGIVAVLSVVKEFLDSEFDWKDIFAAMCGAFTQLFILILKMWFFCDIPYGGLS